MNPKINTPEMIELKTKFLFLMTDWLEKHEIFYFLNLGTALKAYRDNEHDVDIDLGLFMEDRWKVRELLEKDPPEGVMINCLWRSEFSFRFIDYKYPKLDFNFFEKRGNCYYSALYSKNPINGFTNWERGMKFSKKVLRKFKDFKFLGRTFKIPSNIELFFKENYGRKWKIPDPDFVGWGSRPCADRYYREYAIVITTFMRNEKVRNCIDSLLNHYPDGLFRIYLGDQNEKIPASMENYYQKLRKSGHKVYKLPHNCGLSYARNYLVQRVREPYVMIIDDDFLFTKKTDITKFKDVLDSEEDIGIVGGKLSGRNPYVGFLHPNKKQRKIFKIDTFSLSYKTYETKKYPYRPNATEYFDTDIVLNFFLAKTEIFKEIQWDSELLLVEHTDFFIRFKDTKWKVVYTPEVEIDHSTKKNSSEYILMRRYTNLQDSIKIFCEKWNIDSLDNIVSVRGLRLLPIPKNPVVIPPKPTFKEQIKQDVFSEVTSIIISQLQRFVFLKKTCRDLVTGSGLKNPKVLHLGISNISSISPHLLRHGFLKVSETCYEKNEVKIKFERFSGKTKPWSIRGIRGNVPFPVVKYLVKLYGKKITKELSLKGRI